MSDYRRLYIPGGTYFFTLVSYHRKPIFAESDRVEQLRRSFRKVKAKRPFNLLAEVVLPDHLHCLWHLPEGDADFSTSWQMVKADFSRHVPAKTRKNGAKTVWQPRFYDHCIRDENDFHKHLDYIHYNPVKHGLVSTPGEWPHSSFAHFAELGWYTANGHGLSFLESPHPALSRRERRIKAAIRARVSIYKQLGRYCSSRCRRHRTRVTP